MIHNRERWQIRMQSGAVHVVAPITFETQATRTESPFAGPITRALAGNYVQTYAFDRLDSVFAGSDVLIALDKIESITKMDVQIEAGPDAFAD